MKSLVGIVVACLLLSEMVSSQSDVTPSPCTQQEDTCKKNCADGGGEETSCQKTCGSDMEACKCIQEKQCASDECLNGCYENMKGDYDCDTNQRTCLGFCKNQFPGDENCIGAHCDNIKQKCECFKAGNCDEVNATPGPMPMPSCKYLQGKCLDNCKEGEGEAGECDTLCSSEADICACIRKNKCDVITQGTEDFGKCVRDCQANAKDTYNCDTHQKACLGNCKRIFPDNVNCAEVCSASLVECKCLMKGECS